MTVKPIVVSWTSPKQVLFIVNDSNCISTPGRTRTNVYAATQDIGAAIDVHDLMKSIKEPVDQRDLKMVE